MLLQALHVEIKTKNLNFQVTLLTQKVWERVPTSRKGVGTPFPPHYTLFCDIHSSQHTAKSSHVYGLMLLYYTAVRR